MAPDRAEAQVSLRDGHRKTVVLKRHTDDRRIKRCDNLGRSALRERLLLKLGGVINDTAVGVVGPEVDAVLDREVLSEPGVDHWKCWLSERERIKKKVQLATRVYRKSGDAPPLRERHSKKHVGGFGLAVCEEFVVRLALREPGVVVADVRSVVGATRDHHDTRRGRGEDAGTNEVHKEERSEMVRSKLRLEAVDRGGVRRGH